MEPNGKEKKKSEIENIAKQRKSFAKNTHKRKRNSNLKPGKFAKTIGI